MINDKLKVSNEILFSFKELIYNLIYKKKMTNNKELSCSKNELNNSMISKLDNNKNQSIDLETFIVLCEYFNVSEDQIVQLYGQSIGSVEELLDYIEKNDDISKQRLITEQQEKLIRYY